MPCAVADLHLRRQRDRELDEVGVEERHARLDRVRHRHLVDAHQQQLGEAVLELEVGHLLQQVGVGRRPRSQSRSTIRVRVRVRPPVREDAVLERALVGDRAAPERDPARPRRPRSPGRAARACRCGTPRPRRGPRDATRARALERASGSCEWKRRVRVVRSGSRGRARPSPRRSGRRPSRCRARASRRSAAARRPSRRAARPGGRSAPGGTTRGRARRSRPRGGRCRTCARSCARARARCSARSRSKPTENVRTGCVHQLGHERDVRRRVDAAREEDAERDVGHHPAADRLAQQREQPLLELGLLHRRRPRPRPRRRTGSRRSRPRSSRPRERSSARPARACGRP